MNNIDSILVFGATGSCGQAIVERSLARGYRVTAYVRDPGRAGKILQTESAGLTMVSGDIADQDRVTNLVSKHDAVISCLSSFEAPHNSMSTLTGCLVQAADSLNRPDLRLVTYSLCGVEEDGDWVSHAIQGALGIFSPGKFGPAISDHKRVIGLLGSSSLNYTLFQTATMVSKPIGDAYQSGTPEDCRGVRLWDKWGVLDAADVCLDALNQANLRRLQMKYVRAS